MLTGIHAHAVFQGFTQAPYKVGGLYSLKVKQHFLGTSITVTPTHGENQQLYIDLAYTYKDLCDFVNDWDITSIEQRT